MNRSKVIRDYSLTGQGSAFAVQQGLSSADWYRSPISRKVLKQLMRRTDAPAIRDTVIWLALLALSGSLVIMTWGSLWVLPCLLVYGVLYSSAADSRWHECGHGTAFRTRWLNQLVYQLASFMVMKEPTLWRWSHARHHTDTIIIGLDPELSSPRPINLAKHIAGLFWLPQILGSIRSIVRHATGRMSSAEQTYVPGMEQPKVIRTARVWLVLHGGLFAAALMVQSWLPLMLIGVLPTLYGGWLAYLFALTQHAGLQENVLDHRLNTRTIRMNPVFRFVYWNMNYHIEHHMYPMVPYHALPALHAALRDDMPTPYPNTWAALREVCLTLWRQRRDAEYEIRPALPTSTTPEVSDQSREVCHE